MSPVLVFGLLLLLTFGIIIWVLRPSRTELDVQRHLRSIGSMYAVDSDGTTILKQQALSSIPWLNTLLGRVPGCVKLRLFILQSGSNWAVSGLLLSTLLAVLGVAWLTSLAVSSVVLPPLVGAVIGSLPYLYLLLKREARFRRFDTLLPEAIDLMSRALRAGHGVIAAIEMVAQETPQPLSSEFRIVFEEQNLGLPV